MQRNLRKDCESARGIAVGILYGAVLWVLIGLALALWLRVG